MFSKRDLSECDIISKYILPAIEQAGWNQDQIRQEVSFTQGRIFVKGKKTSRGLRKRADIIIYYKANIPVAVVEAKSNKHILGDGMQQALEYAQTLDIPVAIASNGEGFLIQYRNIVIDERTALVAKKIMEYLNNSDAMAKTIVFCVDIEHSERMRQALLKYASEEITKKSNKYIVRITGDNSIAKAYLEDFINPEESFPVIATTSKLMNTGVDAQTCKVICIDENIGSMTEFKQIIGRGTRINEDYGKQYFTIIDFRNVTDKFADKDFDGIPTKIKDAKEDEELSEDIIDEGVGEDPVDPISNEVIVFEEGSPNSTKSSQCVLESSYAPKEKIYINGVDVSILSERRQYLDENGRLITTSIKEYCKKGIIKSYCSLDNFLQSWNGVEKKKIIIEELEKQGIIFEELKAETNLDLDVFDLVCHIAWDAPPLTRKERAKNVRKRNYWTKYGENIRRVLSAMLDKYAEVGIENIEEMKILTVTPFKEIGTPTEIVNIFGGKENYLKALKELEDEIYVVA